MKIIIKSTNVKFNKAVYDFIEKKIGVLEKFFQGVAPDVIEARVEVGKITKHHQKGDLFRAEVNLKLPGRLLRAEASREDIFMAITGVKDELYRQIKEYKTKTLTKYKKGARIFKDKKLSI